MEVRLSREIPATADEWKTDAVSAAPGSAVTRIGLAALGWSKRRFKFLDWLKLLAGLGTYVALGLRCGVNGDWHIQLPLQCGQCTLGLADLSFACLGQLAILGHEGQFLPLGRDLGSQLLLALGQLRLRELELPSDGIHCARLLALMLDELRRLQLLLGLKRFDGLDSVERLRS